MVCASLFSWFESLYKDLSKSLYQVISHCIVNVLLISAGGINGTKFLILVSSSFSLLRFQEQCYVLFFFIGEQLSFFTMICVVEVFKTGAFVPCCSN